jgi:hypothetical protein
MDKRFVVSLLTFLLALFTLPLAGATYLRVLQDPGSPRYVDVIDSCPKPVESASPELESSPSATPSVKR